MNSRSPGGSSETTDCINKKEPFDDIGSNSIESYRNRANHIVLSFTAWITMANRFHYLLQYQDRFICFLLSYKMKPMLAYSSVNNGEEIESCESGSTANRYEDYCNAKDTNKSLATLECDLVENEAPALPNCYDPNELARY